MTTTDDGSVVVSNLDMGVYLVEETGTGEHAITKNAAPFFVTIPLPFDGKWITNVHVYPKNVVQTPGTKEVSDDKDTHKVGDVLEWTITTTATSGQDGVVAFNGIYLGTFDKATAAQDAKKEFCLKETKAPAGYVLSETVKKVTITAGPVAGDAVLDTVMNTPQEGPDLPLTGATGTLLLTVVGIGLVGAGVALYAVNSRSRKQR